MTEVTEREENWKPVASIDGCTFSGYECSDKGRYRSIDRKSGSRQLKGKILATRLDGDGYVLVNIRCDSTDPAHNRVHTFLGHKVILTTFRKPCPPGMEARHSNRGPAFNWWPEGFEEGGWGTKPENHADMVAAGTAVAPPPSFPCRNHDRCGGMVKNPGRRCLECIQEVGRISARLLSYGMPLQDVAHRFGYTGPDWVFKLAAEYGGFDGTPAGARTQQPNLAQRIAIRYYLRNVHDV